MKNCGVSRWDSAREINRKLEALTAEPIWEVNDDYYENEILKYYDDKCKASRAVYEEAKEYIPGGVQHNLAFNKPFPVCMTKAEGAYLYDKLFEDYKSLFKSLKKTYKKANSKRFRTEER